MLALSVDAFQSWGWLPVVAWSASRGQARAGKALATNQPTCRPQFPRESFASSLASVAVCVTIAPGGGIDRCRKNAETSAEEVVHIGELDRHAR